MIRYCTNLLLVAGSLFQWMEHAVAAPEAAWEAGDSFRRQRLRPALGERTGFTAMPVEWTGVRFTNSLGEQRYLENMNLLNGSGVALGDFDGDGRCDVYLCGLERPSALYRNLGECHFEDVSRRAGAACEGQASTGAAFADIDGDGLMDLLVNSMGGPNALLVNEGGGRFTNLTAAAGVISTLGSTSLALADVDGNGTLDLYVANYGATSLLRSGGGLNIRYVNGRPIATGRYAKRIRILGDRIFELGEPDVLYLNDGHRHFAPVAWTGGAFLDESGKPLGEAYSDQSLTVLMADLNGDRAPDIYVCGDASTPDRYWVNDGTGRFRALPWQALRQTAYFSMSVAMGDVDADGNEDLFVTDMLSRERVYAMTQRGVMHDQPRVPGDSTSRLQTRRNVLFHARGDGTYEEIAFFAGIEASEWTWSCLLVDVDLDGWDDLLVSNGFLHNVDDLDTRERIRKMGNLNIGESRRTFLMFERLDTPDLAFRNGHDLTFRETGQEWGFDSKRISNGMAMGDLDGDGDRDIVVNCFADGALVYRNDSTAPRLAVQLRGQPPNREGVGARIRVLGGPVPQMAQMLSGGHYMGGDDYVRTFATGSATNVSIEVSWQSGAVSVIRDAAPGYLYELDEPVAASHPVAVTSSPATWFRDESDLLAHVHVESPFDDFGVQKLLPYRLSQLGPGVAWWNVDNEEAPLLVVGAGRGGRLEAFQFDAGQGRWIMRAEGATNAVGDNSGLAGWTSGSGAPTLLAGEVSIEAAPGTESGLALWTFEGGSLRSDRRMSLGTSSPGPVAVADVDGDSDLDVFVGSRVIPGRYPEAASSRLFLNQGGNLVPDSGADGLFSRLGLAVGACWTDITGDGWPDLVVACEWGPIRVWVNDRGRLREATREWRLDAWTGLWSGVAAGDLDGDGRMDLVAGNWGLNSPYRATVEHPLRVFHGDLDGNGGYQVIEAYDDPVLGTVPRRDLDVLTSAWPSIGTRFASRREFAESTLAQVLGEARARAVEHRAATLATTVFLNRGDHFEPAVLPREAQYAPVFGVCVGDFDGDGEEDVFLSQNLCATPEDQARLDAGRGLILKGAGGGRLVACSGQATGIAIYGEQRGCAVGDYDADGRLDLVAAQNAAATRVFRNVTGRPGLRVRLEGPTLNPQGIGARIRLEVGGQWRAARELHAGSGYWSQDDTTVVMAAPGVPSRIEVIWPGGHRTVSAVPVGARSIRVTPSGEVTAGR